MIQKFALSIFACMVCAAVFSQNLAGVWKGTGSAQGMRCSFELHIEFKGENLVGETNLVFPDTTFLKFNIEGSFNKKDSSFRFEEKRILSSSKNLNSNCYGTYILKIHSVDTGFVLTGSSINYTKFPKVLCGKANFVLTKKFGQKDTLPIAKKEQPKSVDTFPEEVQLPKPKDMTMAFVQVLKISDTSKMVITKTRVIKKESLIIIPTPFIKPVDTSLAANKVLPLKQPTTASQPVIKIIDSTKIAVKLPLPKKEKIIIPPQQVIKVADTTRVLVKVNPEKKPIPATLSLTVKAKAVETTSILAKPLPEKKQVTPALLPAKVAAADTLPVAAKTVPVPVYKKRVDETATGIVTASDSVHIDLYDNGIVDHDTVTLYINDKLLMLKKELTTHPISIVMYLQKGLSKNILRYVADNLGEIPPNTGLLVIRTKEKEYRVLMKADFTTNNTVDFILKE